MNTFSSKATIGFVFLATMLTLIGCSAQVENTTTPSKAGFTNIVLTDDKTSTTSDEAFNANTPEIFVTFGLSNVPVGDKIKGAWVCEESKEAPPNYEIDAATIVIGPGVNNGNFSLSKPNKGWPAGKYRVDLYWNDKVVESVKFTVGQ